MEMYNRAMHIAVTLRGNEKKIALFHAIVKHHDRDWPIDKNLGRTCSECKGLVYPNPLFDLNDLKALAAQINDDTELGGHLKLKAHQWISASKCYDRHQKK